MATGATPEGGNADEGGVWLTVSELARQRGVTKGPMSRRVERFVERGLVETRPGERGSKLVNVAQFLKAAEETEDVVRAINGAGSDVIEPRADKPAPAVYGLEQARAVRLTADLRQLDLDERLGKLLPVEAVETAMARCAEAMVRQIEQLPSLADDIATAIARDGVQGVRRALKEAARGLRDRLAAEMHLLAAGEAGDGGDA